jgi:hypothetical protein
MPRTRQRCMVATARKIDASIIAAHHPDRIPRIERHGEPDEAAATVGPAIPDRIRT